MKALRYNWNEPGALEARLVEAITEVSVRILPQHKRPISLTLWHSDGVGVKIQSEMHKVHIRKEIGVLRFGLTHNKLPDEIVVNLPAILNSKPTFKKLVVKEDGVEAESGLSIQFEHDIKIVVVAGAFPHTLAIKGIVDEPNIFEPEYPNDRYCSIPFI